jgi:3-oxoadipate enol-lactonase
MSGAAGIAAAIRAVPSPVRRRVAAAGMGVRRRALGFPEWAIEEIGRSDPAALLDGFRELQHFSSADWIGDVDVPTAVVVTTLDRIVPPARQYKLAAAIPGAAVFEVHGDHDVCVTGPRRFPAAVVEACRWVSVSACAGASAAGRRG